MCSTPVSSATRTFVGPLLVAFGLFAGASAPRPAAAQCTYPSLLSGTAVTVSASPTDRSFTQGVSYWSAVGIRSLPGDNWDLGVYQTTAPSPACVSGLLGQSQMATGVDFVVGDFNVGANPTGTYYVQGVRSSGAGSATLEWDDGPHLLVMNDAYTFRDTGPSDVIEIWDVYLDADVTYVFTFGGTGADMKFYVFEHPAFGAYWAGPGNAKKTAAGGNVSYTPDASGFHSVVVVNQDGEVGTYYLGVATCTQSIALTPGVSVSSSSAENYYSVSQTVPFWMGVGVRGTSDWQVEAYRSLGLGLYPSCLLDLLGSSTLPVDGEPALDFVVGNFNNEVQGTYYVHTFLNHRLSPGTGRVEWDSGLDGIDVNAAPVSQPMAADDVLDVWDVFMEAGKDYSIHFVPTGANLKLLLIRDTGSAWFGRWQAEFTASVSLEYTAPVEGFYGFVVVNESGTSGSYELGATTSLVGVEENRPARTGVSAVMPNPMRGKLRVAYTLSERAWASFEVLDVAGRVISEIPGEAKEPGRWEVVWAGTGENGARAAPGVYFLRMKVDGQSVEERKVIMLR